MNLFSFAYNDAVKLHHVISVTLLGGWIDSTLAFGYATDCLSTSQSKNSWVFPCWGKYEEKHKYSHEYLCGYITLG